MPGVRPNEYDAREEGAQFCHGGAEAISGVVWCIPAQVSGFRSRCRWPGQAGCAVLAGWRHGHGSVCHQYGEPSQAAEVAVCRLHAVCGTRRRQWQYLGTSVGGAGVLVLLFKIGRRPGRDLAICFGARRPRRVGDMRGGWSAVHVRHPLYVRSSSSCKVVRGSKAHHDHASVWTMPLRGWQSPLRGRGLHAQAAAASLSASGGCGWTMKLAASLPSAPAAPVFS
jgi:hypothetical protein